MAEDGDREERLDRELIELLNELRAVLPGVEVLFAFLLTVAFTGRFEKITPFQTHVYDAALLSTAAAIVLLIAPSAYHRVRWRQHDKEQMLRTANRQAIGGTVMLALSLTAVILVVTDVVFSAPAAAAAAGVTAAAATWLWWGLPLSRRLRDSRRR